MLQPVFQSGILVYQSPSVQEIRAHVQHQLKNQVWEEEQRFENPHLHYVDMTPALYELRARMLRMERE